MNIQIFGTKKNFDSKKAERYFKERGIKYQFIDMKEKGLSKGEFQSVCQAIGGYDKLIDTDCKDKDLLALILSLIHIWIHWKRIWHLDLPETKENTTLVRRF